MNQQTGTEKSSNSLMITQQVDSAVAIQNPVASSKPILIILNTISNIIISSNNTSSNL